MQRIARVLIITALAAAFAQADTPSMDGLVLWLDAADPGSLVLDDKGGVRTWRDRSPAGNHARSSTKISPTYVPKGRNECPALRFEGKSRLETPPLATQRGSVTLFAVFSRPRTMASNDKWQRILSCWDGSSPGDNKGSSFMLCVPEQGNLKPTIFSELLSDRHRGKLSIGANSRHGGGGLSGHLSEILVYNRGFLVDEQSQAVKAYLRKKWQIPEEPEEAWTRQGLLGELPARTNSALPLSDQQNAKNWERFVPMWDEFEGGTLDTEKWWDHNPTWYGRQPARFLGEGQNVHVSDGMLHLVMKRDNALPRVQLYRGRDPYHSYSSASVVSKGLALYGYFEICSRAMDSGGSSAFWFSSSVKDRATGKSYRSEIDVFEIGGKNPGHEKAYHMNAHIFETPTDGTRHWSEGGTWTAPFRFADGFHVFGLEWTPKELAYYVDGVCVRRMRNTHWHAPQHLIFDSETMGSWLGMPKDEDLPSTFSVRYVRAWKNASTRGQWREKYAPRGDLDKPTAITRYVRSMDGHGK